MFNEIFIKVVNEQSFKELSRPDKCVKVSIMIFLVFYFVVQLGFNHMTGYSLTY